MKEYATATSGGGSTRISTLNGGEPGRGLRTTTGQGRVTVSQNEAANVSKSMNKAPVAPIRGGSVKAGLAPVSETTGNKSTGPNQLTARPGKIPVNSPVIKSMQTTRTTPADVRESNANARNARLTKALTPIKPRGTKSSGKTIIGPKANPRTVTVAKPGKATEANKVINPPLTRMGNPAKGDIPKQTESRRIALKNAGSDSRNAFQPSNKTPAQREQEQRPDINPVRTPSVKDPAQREADARAAQGLRKINSSSKGKVKPDMAKQPVRSPNYTKRNIAGFKRVTGGTE